MHNTKEEKLQTEILDKYSALLTVFTGRSHGKLRGCSQVFGLTCANQLAHAVMH